MSRGLIARLPGRAALRMWAGAAVLAALILPAPSHGFGLRTHLWIGKQVLADLGDGQCRVKVAIRDAGNRDVQVPDRVCHAIQAKPHHFLAGTIGPDGFPDILFGQTVVHPGAGRPFSAWLDLLLEKAVSDEEIAFAYGYAVHAAGDSFAHSYVNNYAGGIFDLTQRASKDVELRHILLEKYIDQNLPAFNAEEDELEAPLGFIMKTLVFPDAAPRPEMRANPLDAFAELRAFAVKRAKQADAIVIETRATKDSMRSFVRSKWSELHYEADPLRGLDRRDPAFVALSRRDQRKVEGFFQPLPAAVRDWRDAEATAKFANAWKDEVEAAATAYVGAALETVRIMAAPSGKDAPDLEKARSATLPFQRWFHCYADVLAGAPSALGEALCAKLDAFPGDVSLTKAQLRAGLPPFFRTAYVSWTNIDRQLSELYRKVAIRALSHFDRTRLLRIVQELSDPATVRPATLNDEFARSGNGQLRFRCVSDYIDADLGLRDTAPEEDAPCTNAPRRESIDPARFVALRHAVTLAKLSLLDGDHLKEVATAAGGPAEQVMTSPRRHYSLLVDSVYSIDGNQQWTRNGMPPPRAKAYPRQNPKLGPYGHPPGNASPYGFPFYRTEALRGTVFSRLFDARFEGAILSRPEMAYPFYPFLPCVGDPFRVRPQDESQAIRVCPDAN